MFSKLIAALAISSIAFSAMPAKADPDPKVVNEAYAAGILYASVCLKRMGVITQEDGIRRARNLLTKNGISTAIVNRQSVQDLTMEIYDDRGCADIVEKVNKAQDQNTTRI